MAKMYWWKSLTVTYQFHNLFGEILFLIEAVNWISGSYEHNKSDFFSADLTTDRIPRHCTISPSSFTQPFLGSSFTSKLGDCLTAFSSAPSHQGWSQACPKGHQLVEVGAQAPRGPPRLLWFLMISPIFIFPVCSSRNSPSSLHERFPSSKDVSDISTTRNPCSFPFWERLLLWCRRGFLSSGTLVLQPRICPAQRTGFLASSHQIFSSSSLHFSVWKMGHWICSSNTWTKFGWTGEWKKLLHWYSATHPLELNHVVHKCSRSMGKRTGIGV